MLCGVQTLAKQIKPHPRAKIAAFKPQTDTRTWKQNASTKLAISCKTSALAPSSCGGIFDYDAKFERLRTVNASLEDPSVWNEPKKAKSWAAKKNHWKTSCWAWAA